MFGNKLEYVVEFRLRGFWGMLPLTPVRTVTVFAYSSAEAQTAAVDTPLGELLTNAGMVPHKVYLYSQYNKGH